MIFLLACTDPPAPQTPDNLEVATAALPASDAPLIPLSPTRLLRRMSLDLRGILPDVSELDAVEADPSLITQYRDAYLEDPLFEQRMVLLLGERWQTRVDEYLIHFDEYRSLSTYFQNEYPFERAVGEEPLRLMAHIVAQDRPWTEVVTADYTMANEMLAGVWPIERAAGDGWIEAHYTDGRPAAGVLATNGLWWRYYTTISNYNRGRAAAISRLLLCQDYLARPVSFTNSVALVDKNGIEEALRSNPYCEGCHSSLDPAASTLFGFWVANEYNSREMDHYHAEREPLGQYLLHVDAAWFGTPLSGLAQMGQEIAQDPRFSRCAAQSMAEIFWRREVAESDFARINDLEDSYLSHDQSMKAVLRSLTDAPVYQAGSLSEEATEDQQNNENTTRLMDATLLWTVLRNLTGWSWNWEGFETLDNDTYGYRILGGGVDGSLVTRPQRTPSLTWSLTVQRASEGAGYYAADSIGRPESFFHYVQSGSQPQDSAFDQEISELYWQLYADHPDDAWKTAIGQLWSAVQQREGERMAWAALLSAMIRDPLFTSY